MSFGTVTALSWTLSRPPARLLVMIGQVGQETSSLYKIMQCLGDGLNKMETRLFNGEGSIEAVLDTMEEKAAVTLPLTNASLATSLVAAAATCSRFLRSSAVLHGRVLS